MASSATPLFADLGVCQEIVAALTEMNIERAFAIQELALPIALSGNDVIGQARTGTGKTLAFGIPIVQHVRNRSEGNDGFSQALVIVPTRELCLQVARDISMVGAHRQIRVATIYGGRPYEPQITTLQQGVEVVVGTPGRLLDLAQQGHLRLHAVRMLVLDEADEMLDLGFLPDVERILGMLTAQRQTMLFSATMPGPVVSLARQFMNKPTHVSAEHLDDSTAANTTQHVYRTHALDKNEILARVLQADGRGRTMVFCRTKRLAQQLSEELSGRGFAAVAVHGDLAQAVREKSLRAFRSGRANVLVATDVAARGIDIDGVTHVINYQCPDDEKTYIHRIGRTGRAGASGVAVTLIDWEDLARWQSINRALSLSFDDPPETYSTSDHLFAELGIPTTVAGAIKVTLNGTAPGYGQASHSSTKSEPGIDARRPTRRRRRRNSDHSTPAPIPTLIPVFTHQS